MRALGFEPRQLEIDEMIDKMLKNTSARADNKGKLNHKFF